VSPHVDRARAHCRAWAVEMGMVADEPDPERAIWDPATFATMDFALFAASTHPDAPAPVLDLLADWYVWLFYVDDVLTEVHGRGGMPPVKELVARTMACMPPAEAAPATPTTPAERGAVDLCARTAGLTSPDWFDRMTGHMRDTLREMRWSLSNIDQGRMPNPVEHIEARRAYGGMMWAADMVEVGCSIELDRATVELRPVRLLDETWGDAVGLRNDLVSFRKEIEGGEEAGNAVAVFRDFLDCDLGTAAKIVHDLYSARLRQFDHLVDVDLPEVVADLRIDPATQDLVHRKVAGLRDWLAGDEHWILTSGRYLAPTPGETEPLARAAAVALLPEPPSATPTTRLGRGPSGLGTSAARPRGVRSTAVPPSS
jgi:germacradienol/geosmin synthase